MFAPDNDVLSSNDSANGNWIYSYDDFNRLLTATGPNSQNFGYEYDQFGNRWDQTGPNMSSLAFDANNHVTASGITYDANGNTTDDGVHPYLYDAENHLIADDQPAYQDYYLYDAEGRRVRRISGGWTFDYVYDLAGRPITEMEGLSPDRLEIYAGGRHLATANQCQLVYNHADWLGTERVRTNASDTQYPAVVPGSVANTCTSLPFGDNLSCTLVPDVNPNHGDLASTHFTGKDRDPETNLDYFGARFYTSAMGRWMSPDWSAKQEPVPYSKLDNPQTLNLYSYVVNNPLSQLDDDGHEIRYAENLKNMQLVKDTVQAELNNPNTRGYLSGYDGENNPDLVFQSGDLSSLDNPNQGPDGSPGTSITQGLTSPDIQTTTGSSTDSNGVTTADATATTLTGATITIDTRTSTGDTPGVILHESVHAGEAQANPAQFNKDAAAEKSLPHDKRPQEQRANAVRGANIKNIKRAIRQTQKNRKKDSQ